MEENKFNRNFTRIESIKHYCRVCTSNSKTKKYKSEEQNIRIFQKIGLKSILEKFLHLEISEDDPLPKTICKKCFDKVMAIEFLQVVAKRSESLFNDFLSNKSQAPQVGTYQEIYESGFIIKSPPRNIENKPEEVVVDVSMSDPLTKDIKKKLQVAQSKRDSMGMAFSPDQLNRNAVTSSPLVQVPVTIVHRMPKKRKVAPTTLEAIKIPNPQTNTTTVTLENPKKKLPSLKQKIDPTSPLRHISEAPTIPQNVEIHPVVTGNPHPMGHGMPLGSIIKDVDLLKLILKALKWPYNSQTLDIQIQRLKDTNFNDIIVDPNLLQDTDLIQILGPLLAPLPVTMQQQTYHITIPPETMETPPTTMSYKLPAETSVQIITVPAAEKEPPIRKQRPSKRHMKSSVMRKLPGNNLAPRQKINPQVIVVSDDSNDDQFLPTALANEEIPSFGVQLDPAVYPGVGDNSNSNEAMLATLNRQREAMMRMHRSKRKQSLNCAKNIEMVDDIMIMDEGYQMDEPYPEIMPLKKNRETHVLPVASASSSQRKAMRSIGLVARESAKKDLASPSTLAQNKTHPTVLSKPSTSMKSVQRPTEYLKSEKSTCVQGFVKLKEDLPPLKKVKILSRSPSYVQLKEPSKNVYISKNTTVADADSTTKNVIKETKVPKPAKTWKFGSKISKAKKVAQIPKSESESQSISGVKTQENKGNEKEKKDEDEEVIVVVECIDDCDAAEKKAGPVIAVPEKKKSRKKSTLTRPPEAKKNEYKILATFDISDEEMEPLRVEDVSEEFSVQEKNTIAITTATETATEATTAATTETTTATTTATTTPTTTATATTTATTSVSEKDPSLKMSAASVVEEESKIEASVESIPADSDPSIGEIKVANSIELPALEIKSEDNDEIEIKKEDIESIDDGQTLKAMQVGSPSKAQRNFVASKTSIKSEIVKFTRSSVKRKVPQKEEEPPKETTNFRPARKSKTLSKYYKGPPLSGTAGRSMRSRT